MRPIFYRGANSENEGGHIFVVDGRDSNGLYHVNWGWNGYCNGYFALTDFRPETSNDFRYYHGIVHHLRPATGDERFSPLITENYKGGNGLSMNRENIKANDPFFASVSRLSSRMCDVSISGELALALVDESGKIREVLSTDTYSLKPNYGYQTYNFSQAKSSVDANPGDRLALMYKDENEENTEWTQVSSSYGAPSSIPAYGFSPEYAGISWILGDGIVIRTTSNQHSDRALKSSRYSFKFNVDPEIPEIKVSINDEEINPTSNGWYRIDYVDKDVYTIKAVDPQKGTEGIADMMADPSIPDGVYSLDGVLIEVVNSQESESDTLNKLTPGIYIVKNGNNVKKVVVKN